MKKQAGRRLSLGNLEQFINDCHDHFLCLSHIALVYSFFLAIAVSLTFVSMFMEHNQNAFLAAYAQPKEDGDNSSSNNQLSLSNLIGRGSPYYGNISSPIVIIDFSDFQCHLCKRHVDNTEQQINSTYVQTGKAIYVFKHLPNRGFDSKPASLAAQCTNDQGKFWDFHKILYENQGPIDSGWVNIENIKKFALQLQGLDIDQFNTCFESKKYAEFINSDILSANSLGFTETPSFIIVNSDGSNPQKIEGPKPFPIFQSVIEKLENEK